MSAGGNPHGHDGSHDPEVRVGRGKPARRRIAAFGIGVVVVIFAVLLVVWLLGRSAADAQSTAGAGSVAPVAGDSLVPGGPGPPGHLLLIE